MTPPSSPIPPRPADLPAGRWSEAALRVLRERYLLKDARGQVIETPEDLCWRVAWTVAQAERAWGADDAAIEALARAFDGLMARREFLPNSPTLMNAGKGRGLTFAACFPQGTQIVAIPARAQTDTLLPIESLKPGDLVLTHLGRWRPVQEVFCRHFSGDLVRLQISGHQELRLTPEHPVLATPRAQTHGERLWIPATLLVPGDHVYAVFQALGRYIPEPPPRHIDQDHLELYIGNGTTYTELTPLRIEHSSREPYTGPVWNLDVEEDHSYTAHFIAVHNCFVLPIEDSIPGIFGTLQTAAIIQKAGGGTGFAFSRLRPQGSRVRSSGGTSSGPVSFLRDAYNPMTDAVKQGSTRRGANMAILRCDHPDLLAFIDAKRDGGLRNFNISVGITDEFMAALARDDTYPLRARAGWPRPDGSDYADGEPYRDPDTGQPLTLRAREVWDRICQAAWATGDPGLFFLDRTNRWRANPVPSRYQVESTNPCVPGNTLVATPAGWVPAEKLAPGDWILTPAGPRRLARVERSRHPVSRVRLSDGGEVRATAGHQFFARPAAEPGRATRPIRLDQLGRGDVVRVLRQGHPTLRDWIGEATILSVTPDGVEEVYDLYEPTTDSWLPQGYLSRGCGEQPLYPNDQCTLGSLNLGAFADPAAGTFAWDRLGAAAALATRFLDNVLEASPAPTPAIAAMVHAIRRIGLGVMGWADALIRLGLPYDSEAAVTLAGQVMRFLTDAAAQASVQLAASRGPFPLWAESIYRDGPPRRNATVTTIAPTGTISLIAGCSSGIEPLYAIAFTHTVRRPEGDRVLPIVNPLFEEIARARGLFTEALMAEVARRGTVRGLREIPEDLQRLFGTAHEIDLEWHVRHQAAFQQHTDNGVSKTINVPHSATVADVDRAYRLAWELGCLGITVFRDGCKGEQVLTLGTTPPAAAPVSAPPPPAPSPAPDTPPVRRRPTRLEGPTFKLETPLGTAYITVTVQDGEPLEVFVNIGKSGTDTGAFAEALGRLVSLLLRLERLPSRADRAREIADQLRQIGGSRDIGLGPHRIRSVPDAVAWALQQALQPPADPRQLPLPTPPASDGPAPHRLGDLCPECGAAAVVYEEGCRHCLACGLYAEC